MAAILHWSQVLTGQLWAVCGQDSGENWPRYNDVINASGAAMSYYAVMVPRDFPCYLEKY